jgi:hypothetical protein
VNDARCPNTSRADDRLPRTVESKIVTHPLPGRSQGVIPPKGIIELRPDFLAAQHNISKLSVLET